MRFAIRNWRSIEHIEGELVPITILIGRNATGKSNIAYAIYFLAKACKYRERINDLTTWLYGLEPQQVARQEGGRPQYPIEIIVEGKASASFDGENWSINCQEPWAKAYLLPSTRISFMKLTEYLGRIMKEISPEGKDMFTGMFLRLVSPEFIRVFQQPPAVLFYEDLYEVLSGGETKKPVGPFKGMGSVTMTAQFMPLGIRLLHHDELTNTETPLDSAPDGSVDTALIMEFINNAEEKSLVIIEEPEIHKNPALTIDLTSEIVSKALEKELTVIITTHSDIVTTTIAKIVTENKQREKATIYHTERNKEKPWTNIRKIEIYEDGTTEEFPGAEEVLTKLFQQSWHDTLLQRPLLEG